MTNEVDFLKSEYEQSMAESRQHLSTASTIVSLEIGALGVGIPLGVAHLYVLPALAGLTVVLWLRCLDHVGAMYRIAGYVAVELRSRLASIIDTSSILGWESFLRKLRAGEYRYPCEQNASRVVPREKGSEARLGLTYTFLLFGVSTPSLIIAFCWASLREDAHDLGVITAVGAVGGAAWVYSLLRWRWTMDWVDEVNKMISTAEV